MAKFDYKNCIGDHNTSIWRRRNAIAMDFSTGKWSKAHLEIFERLLFAKKIDVLDWPSQSPDLKPIENLGDILKYQLPSRTFINKKDLWVFVQKSWYEMLTTVCQTLISNMPKRISKNIFNNGGYTGD